MKTVKIMVLILASVAPAWPMMIVSPSSGDGDKASRAASFDGSQCRDKTGTTGGLKINLGSQLLLSEALASRGSFAAERAGFVPATFRNLVLHQQFTPNPFAHKRFSQSGGNLLFPVIRHSALIPTTEMSQVKPQQYLKVDLVSDRPSRGSLRQPSLQPQADIRLPRRVGASAVGISAECPRKGCFASSLSSTPSPAIK